MRTLTIWASGMNKGKSEHTSSKARTRCTCPTVRWRLNKAATTATASSIGTALQTRRECKNLVVTPSHLGHPYLCVGVVFSPCAPLHSLIAVQTCRMDM